MSAWAAFGTAIGLSIIVAAVASAVWANARTKELERTVRELQELAQQPQMAPLPWESPVVKEAEPAPDVMVLPKEIVTRLLDAVFPTREDDTRDEGRPPMPGEYEPPPVEVSDWTDPFFGMTRDVVGGLRPGEPIPGIGQQEEISEWDGYGGDPAALHDDHPLARGFEEYEGDDGTIDSEAARRAGEELFDAWEDSR